MCIEALNSNGEIGSSALVGKPADYRGEYIIADLAQPEVMPSITAQRDAAQSDTERSGTALFNMVQPASRELVPFASPVVSPLLSGPQWLYTVEFESQPVRVGFTVPATRRETCDDSRSTGIHDDVRDDAAVRLRSTQESHEPNERQEQREPREFRELMRAPREQNDLRKPHESHESAETRELPITNALLCPPLPPVRHAAECSDDRTIAFATMPAAAQASRLVAAPATMPNATMGREAVDESQPNGDVHVATMQCKAARGIATYHATSTRHAAHAIHAAHSAHAADAAPMNHGDHGIHGTFSDATKEAAMNGAQAGQAMVDNAAMIGAEVTSTARHAGIPLKVALGAEREQAAREQAAREQEAFEHNLDAQSAALGVISGDSAETTDATSAATSGTTNTPETQLRVPDAASFPEPVQPGTIPVVGAAIMRDGKILCARRPFDKNLGGKWEFPGGKVKPGETYREALEREIREELGCAIEVGDQICTTLNTYRFGTISLVTFRCTLKPGEEPQRLEHLNLRWMDPLDMPSLDWAPADCEAVDLISIEAQG